MKNNMTSFDITAAVDNVALSGKVIWKIAEGFLFNWEALFILCVFGLGFAFLRFLNSSSVSR